MQHRAIRLMASKLAVAGVIEGNLTEEGLAAMSDCADMTTALARELTQGIEGEVEDLGAVFKRMALLKPVVSEPTTDTIAQSAHEEVKLPPQPMGLLSMRHKPNQKRVATKKPASFGENQMTLFDLLDYSA